MQINTNKERKSIKPTNKKSIKSKKIKRQIYYSPMLQPHSTIDIQMISKQNVSIGKIDFPVRQGLFHFGETLKL